MPRLEKKKVDTLTANAAPSPAEPSSGNVPSTEPAVASTETGATETPVAPPPGNTSKSTPPVSNITGVAGDNDGRDGKAGVGDGDGRAKEYDAPIARNKRRRRQPIYKVVYYDTKQRGRKPAREPESESASETETEDDESEEDVVRPRKRSILPSVRVRGARQTNKNGPAEVTPSDDEESEDEEESDDEIPVRSRISLGEKYTFI